MTAQCSGALTGMTPGATKATSPISIGVDSFLTPETETHLYGLQSTTIYWFTVGTRGNVSSVAYQSITFNLGVTASCINVLNNGNKLFYSENFGNAIFTRNFGTPYNPSTLGAATSEVITEVGGNTIKSFRLSPDGTILTVFDGTQKFWYFELSIPYDISSRGAGVGAPVIASPGPTFYFATDGAFINVCEDSGDWIRQYTLATPYDIRTINTTASSSYQANTETAKPKTAISLLFDSKVWLLDDTNDRWVEYTICAGVLPPVDFPDTPLVDDLFTDGSGVEWICVGVSPNIWDRVDVKLDKVNGISTGLFETAAVISALDIDMSVANIRTKDIALTGANTFTFSGWPAAGISASVTVKLNADATDTATFTGVDWGGLTPALRTGNNTYIFESSDGGTNIYGYIAMDGS